MAPLKFPMYAVLTNSISVSGNVTPIQNPPETFLNCDMKYINHGIYSASCAIPEVIHGFKSSFLCFNMYINKNRFISPIAIRP